MLQIFYHRVAWTIFIMFVYILGSSIPVPYARITRIYRRMLMETPINIVSIFSGGGNLARLSLFTVGLNPMMIAMLIVQLFMTLRIFAFDTLSQNQIQVFQQVFTLILAAIESTTITIGFGLTQTMFQAISVVIILTTGAMFVGWLGQVNGVYGIGGAMIIIVINVLNGIFPALRTAVNNLRTVPHGGIYIALLIIAGLGLVYFWTAFSRAYYPMKFVDVMSSSRTEPLTMPYGMNAGAMMTYMMGMAIMMLPMMLSRFIPGAGFLTNPYFDGIFAGVMCFLLFYFFSFMQLSPINQARSMRAADNYLLDVRPGKPTHHYLRNRLLMLTFWGALLNSLQMSFGMMGGAMLGKYAGFAIIPMDTVMIIMFMSGIRETILMLLIPHRYVRYMRRRENY